MKKMIQYRITAKSRIADENIEDLYSEKVMEIVKLCESSEISDDGKIVTFVSNAEQLIEICNFVTMTNLRIVSMEMLSTIQPLGSDDSLLQ